MTQINESSGLPVIFFKFIKASGKSTMLAPAQEVFFMPGRNLATTEPLSLPAADHLASAASASASIACPDCLASCFKLHGVPDDLDGERLTRLARTVWRQRRPLNAGQVLVRQGDSMEALYALRVGSLKALIDEPNGAERVVGFRFPGAVIGLAEFEQSRWMRTFVALEDTWLCRFPLQTLDETLRRQLVKLVSERLRLEYQTHLTLALKSGPRRVASFLLDISGDFSSRGLSPCRFHLSMTYTDIANYLGMRHESVSRVFARLQELGLLRKRRKTIQILDLEGLRRVHDSTLDCKNPVKIMSVDRVLAQVD